MALVLTMWPPQGGRTDLPIGYEPRTVKFPHNQGVTKAEGVDVRALSDGACIVTGKGAMASVPAGWPWSLEKEHNGLTDGSSDQDTLGTLHLDPDNIRYLVKLLQHQVKDHQEALDRTKDFLVEELRDHQVQVANLDARRGELREAKGLLKQLYRIAEAMKVKGVEAPEPEEKEPVSTEKPSTPEVGPIDRQPTPALPLPAGWVILTEMVGGVSEPKQGAPYHVMLDLNDQVLKKGVGDILCSAQNVEKMVKVDSWPHAPEVCAGCVKILDDTFGHGWRQPL